MEQLIIDFSQKYSIPANVLNSRVNEIVDLLGCTKQKAARLALREIIQRTKAKK